MKKISFAEGEFFAKKGVTRRERFLSEMQGIVPWAALRAVLAPDYYPASASTPAD